MTAEQQAREMLARIDFDLVDRYTAGDLVDLANLIAERDALKAALNELLAAAENFETPSADAIQQARAIIDAARGAA